MIKDKTSNEIAKIMTTIVSDSWEFIKRFDPIFNKLITGKPRRSFVEFKEKMQTLGFSEGSIITSIQTFLKNLFQVK
jgi:hypothetical protein